MREFEMMRMPKLANQKRVMAYVDWLDRMPIKYTDAAHHPEYRARSARLSDGDWQEIGAEYQRRIEGPAPRLAPDGPNRELILKAIVWIVLNPDRQLSTDREFLATFGELTRADIRTAVAELELRRRS